MMTRCLLVPGLLLAILWGCQQQPDYPQRQMPAGLLTDTDQITAGRKLFMEKCVSCHGKPDEGRSERAAFFDPPAPDFHEQRYRQSDPAYLYWRIEAGKTAEPFRSQGSVMPAWGPHFSSQQIWQLVAYLKSRAG